ncbi:hypothetical protein ACJX0J_013216, partial [Zea mays]
TCGTQLVARLVTLVVDLLVDLMHALLSNQIVVLSGMIIVCPCCRGRNESDDNIIEIMFYVSSDIEIDAPDEIVVPTAEVAKASENPTNGIYLTTAIDHISSLINKKLCFNINHVMHRA